MSFSPIHPAAEIFLRTVKARRVIHLEGFPFDSIVTLVFPLNEFSN